MNTGGISLAYLPPFSIVARFFLTASLFGVFTSLLGLYMAIKDVLNLPALIHGFTLGFMAMTMLGALFQMLPVVAGAVINRSLQKAFYTHTGLIGGTLLAVIYFLKGDRVVALSGGILLLTTLLSISTLMLHRLLAVETHTPTSKGMRYAIGALVGGTLVGGSLILIPELWGAKYDYGLRLHLNLMLLGWVGILIASVAFQVIEMFFVTPPYPKRFAWAFPLAVYGSIALTSLPFNSFILKLPASLVFISFALITIDRLLKRRRKLPDPLIRLWHTGMVLLMLSMVVMPFADSNFGVFLLFLFLYGSFAHTIILAMMYRIIPFLVWIHLSNRGVVGAPTMHEVIEPKRAWLQLYLHILCLVSFGLSFLTNYKLLWVLTALLYTTSFSFLSMNLGKGILIYVRKAYQKDDAPQRKQGQL